MRDTSREVQPPGGRPVTRLEGCGDVRVTAVLHVPKPKIQVTFYQTASQETRDLHHFQDYAEAEKESERLPKSCI